MPPLAAIENLNSLLTQVNQKFISSANSLDSTLLEKVISYALENKEILNTNREQLLSEWKKFSVHIAAHLTLPLNSNVYRQVKSINAYLGCFFPNAACGTSEDVIQTIISHLTIDHNAFMFPLAPHLKAIACVSKKWNYFISEIQILHAKKYACLKSQERLLLQAKCKTAEEAVNFAIAQQLQVVNLKNFQDLTDELLEKLFKGCPNLKHAFIESQLITKLPSECVQLETLTCKWCLCLTSLPPMPNLQILNCRYCPRLNSLPAMPKLISLDCHGCHRLSTLAHMPNLKALACTLCEQLTALPDMPNLKVLDCCRCQRLASLPPMPNLKIFNYDHCPQLKGLPDMSKLTSLGRYNCTELTIQTRKLLLKQEAYLKAALWDSFSKQNLSI